MLDIPQCVQYDTTNQNINCEQPKHLLLDTFGWITKSEEIMQTLLQYLTVAN